MYRYIISLIFIQIASFVNAGFLKFTATYNEAKIDAISEIIFDPELTSTKKFETLSAHSSLSLYTEYFDKLYPVYNKLLEESSKQSDTEGMFFAFCSMANLFFCKMDRGGVDKYLNLAEKYLEQVVNKSNLAFYNRLKAQYVQRYLPDRMPEAVNNYQISLSLYDKAGTKGKEDEIAIILRNLSMDAFIRNDSAYINKSVRKLKEIRHYHISPIVEFYYLDVKSTLFNVFHHYSSEDRFLDSTVFYLRKCLELHDKRLLPSAFDYLCLYLYTIVAETISMKKNPDFAVIDSLLSIAVNNNIDSLGMARVFQIKARNFFNRNMIDSAEMMALKSQSYLESGRINDDYLLEKRNIDFLRAIYEIRGDYKQVIDYNNLWDKKTEEVRANEVKKLELQFEVEMKESELKRLSAEGLYHENLNKLYILACTLLCFATLFLIFYFELKKRNLKSQIALIAAQREEAELKVKLQEEQTVKMQLEKYMALSDFRLKELEIIGKTKDMEQLYKDKEELDKQVELFRQKVEEFEVSVEQEQQESSDIHYIVMEDLRRLFSRQPSGSKYIEKLEQLNKSYIGSISKKCVGKLTITYLKYCVCFALGMGSNEVSECFNIEPSSVYMMRSRLKKKFGLGNDDDLSRFLQEQGNR